AEGFDTQFLFAGFGEKHDVERLQGAEAAGRACSRDQQIEVRGVQLHFAGGRRVALDETVWHAPGLRHGAVVGDVQRAVFNVNRQVTQGHVEVLAANT